MSRQGAQVRRGRLTVWMLIGSECLRGRLNPTCHLSLNVLVVTLFEGQYFLVICVGFDGKGQDCLKDDNIVDYLNTGGLHIAHFQHRTMESSWFCHESEKESHVSRAAHLPCHSSCSVSHCLISYFLNWPSHISPREENLFGPAC